MNGLQTSFPSDLEKTIIKVATGEMTAVEFADYLRLAFGLDGSGC